MEQHTKKIEYQQQQQQPKTECQASEQGECEREGLRGQKETALSRTKTCLTNVRGSVESAQKSGRQKGEGIVDD